MCEKVYDDYQKSVIAIDSDYNLVLAPPGCGKTDILAERIVKAHQAGIPYSDMMCLTFTNRASKGMRERIAQRTNNPVPDDLFVGNLHRFCSQFLFKQRVIPQNTGILDENDSFSIIYSMVYPNRGEKELSELSFKTKKEYKEIEDLQHLLYQIKHQFPISIWLHFDEFLIRLELTYKNRIMGTSDLSENMFDNEENIKAFSAYITELYNEFTYTDIQGGIEYDIEKMPLVTKVQFAIAYQKYKEENDLIDFDDLLIKTYEYVSVNHESIHKYKWIQIDEVQDLNRLQFAIVDYVTAIHPTVVYLGDEQQAIFSFMGAKIQTMEWLKDRCEGHLFRLYKNYRSPKYLLDVYNTYAIKQLGIDEALLPSPNSDPPHEPKDLYCACINALNENSAKTAMLAKKYNEVDNGTVAVLVTKNIEADFISRYLDSLEVQHFKVSGNDVFSSKEMQLIMSHISVVQNEISFTSWAKIFYQLNIIRRQSKARDFMRALKEKALLPTDLLFYIDSSYIQDFVSAYKDKEIVLFDTETTGLDIYNDDIVQIAAIKIRNGQKVLGSDKVIYLKMHEGKSLPLEIGGEKNPMIEALAEAEKQGLLSEREQGLKEFMDYCKGDVLIAHNITYDYNILLHNLVRDLPQINLRESNPLYFDTLKLIRLLEPRLKVYKLVNLLAVLNLPGVNSHNAIDDVNATFGLLDYCYTKAKEAIPIQTEFLSNPHISRIAQELCEKYKELYTSAISRIDSIEDGSSAYPLLVQEMDKVYTYFVQNEIIKPINKWNHILRYFAFDLIDRQQHPYLRNQLDAYITDICTSKEADMCGGSSMQEKVFVSTVYKAKGLEFDNVLVTSCNSGNYPFFFSISEEQIQEDARKFYVAISRAKKRLCLIWSREQGAITPFIKPIAEFFSGSTQ